MSAHEESLAYIRAQFAGTAAGAGLEFLIAQDHATRVDTVQRAVDFACNWLVEHKNRMKEEYGEDWLTIQICGQLNSSGIQTAHDAAVGGHCDVVVRAKDGFLWLAEAKKHSSYTWLDKGFKQLSTRYSTGTPGQDHGGVLIYCFVKNAKAMLDKWKEELVTRNPDVTTSKDKDGNPLIFQSKHQHVSSGLDFYVRHKVIPLYWDPQDK